ncbi:glycosyltransferase [Alphaproteobacteria bacterium]|nr:glycosyltransferase [Alphaproteobacteria bacterium]
MNSQKLHIVHCATFSANKFGMDYYSGNNKISNGLIRNGHMVHDFSYRDVARHQAPLRIKQFGIDKMNRRLIETVQAIEPELLLLGHSELVHNETLKKLRRLRPNMKIAMWWVDPLDGFLVNRDFFIERIDLVDYFFLTTDPKALKDFLPLEKPLERVHFMPNICDASIDTGRAFDIEKPRHDLLFIGRKTGLRSDLIDFLRTQMTDLNLGLYGQDKKSLTQGQAYIDLLSNCKMAINFSRYNDIPLYSSDRQVHLAANGCLTFTPETPDMKSLFSEDEMVYFANFEELKEKILYYQAHPDEGQRIAEAGHARAHRDYGCQKITKNIIETLSA